MKEKGGEIVSSFFQPVKNFFNSVLFSIQGNQFTLATLIYIIVASGVLIYTSRWVSKMLKNKLLVKQITDEGVRTSITTIVRYSILIFGFLFIFQSAGFDFSTLTYVFTALGVGIGFGLQNITQNFISGIIILFERPVKVGDRIEVGNINGDVTSISMRSTKIVTNDNINIIVPNSELINNKVINWSYNDRRVRFKFPLGVSYKENPEKVRDIVLRVANKHKGVLNYPPPSLWFSGYGDSSLDFLLVLWTSSYIQIPEVLKSELYYEIFNVFTEKGIEIPFPQRDIHVVSTPDTFTPNIENNNS